MNKELDRPGKIHQPNAIRLPCPRCGKSEALRIGQTNFQGKLRWFESANCDKCGLISEADGVGFPPPKIRELLIERDGEWCVLLNDVKSMVGVVKILQSALSLDMKEAVALLRTETNMIFRGTKSEALWLVELLEVAGEVPVSNRSHSNPPVLTGR